MKSQHPTTIWQLIDRIALACPFSKEKIEGILQSGLSESAKAGNDVFQFFESKDSLKVGTATIGSVDLRIKRADDHPGFLVLGLADPCITLAEVNQHYPDTWITDIPRGRSMDEVTSHTASLAWGKLTFAFKVSRPDCVARITFDPSATR